MANNFLKHAIAFGFFWFAMPFINLVLYAILLPADATMIGGGINFMLWGLILLSAMWIQGLREGFSEFIKKNKTKKRSAPILCLTIALLYSFIAAALVALFSKNSFSSCMMVYMPLGVVWGVLANLLYKKEVFSPDNFEEVP